MEPLSQLICAPNRQQPSLLPVDCNTVLFNAGAVSHRKNRFRVESRQVETARWNAGIGGEDFSVRTGLLFGYGSPVKALFVTSLSLSRRSDTSNPTPGRAGLSRRPSRLGFGRQAESTAKTAPIRAKDSSQHDTADRSDAVSENKEAKCDAKEGRLEVQSEVTETRLEISGSCADLAGSNVQAENQGLVLGLGQADAWDSGSIGAPVVRRYLSDNEERWLMWYNGRAAEQQGAEGASKQTEKDSIGLAISSNGIHWERGNGFVDNNEHGSEGVGKVLGCSSNWWQFDTDTMLPSDVLVLASLKVRAAAGVYWMYYTGGCPEEVEVVGNVDLPVNLPDFKYKNGKVTTFRTRPGLAMSHDGRNWARIEGDHHSGSLFDVGAENEWDSLFIAAPHVVFFNADDLRMYYHSFDPKSGRFTVGFARSRDGMKWVKFGKLLGGGAPGSFDELGVKAPQVLPDPNGNGYLMIYEGVAADGSSSFGLARSSNGLAEWERCSDKPVFSTAPIRSAWDSKGVHYPCLVHMDGQEWRLYYQGVDSAGKAGIGMAMCADGKLLEFHRCHGLHL